MPDIRERLRRIETSPPPDLWSEIERRAAKARPEGEPSVIAFRPQGTQVRRRVAAGLLAAAVFALTAVVVWEASRATAPAPKQTATDVPEGWERCTNAALGYSIAYPGDWYTTDVFDGRSDPSYACMWFSPKPFGPDGNLVSEGWGYPLEVREGGPFSVLPEQELSPDSFRVLFREHLRVGGHHALRLEYETLNDVAGENGLHYEYVIQLDPEWTLIVHTTATRGVVGVYAENKVVVDRAVDTLRFLVTVPSSPSAG